MIKAIEAQDQTGRSFGVITLIAPFVRLTADSGRLRVFSILMKFRGILHV